MERDFSGRPLANRAIVLVCTGNYGIQFGVIEELDSDPVRVIIKFKDGHEQIEEVQWPETNIFLIEHNQLPEKIRERLIELSQEGSGRNDYLDPDCHSPDCDCDSRFGCRPTIGYKKA